MAGIAPIDSAMTSLDRSADDSGSLGDPAAFEATAQGSLGARPDVPGVMYGNNTPTQFKIERGSIYTVTNTSAFRRKFDDTNWSGNYRNIFYATDQDHQRLSQYLDHKRANLKSMKDVKVSEGATGEYKFELTLPDGTVGSIPLMKDPQLSMRPMDMVLSADGRYIGEFHPGHKIVEFIGRAPARPDGGDAT